MNELKSLKFASKNLAGAREMVLWIKDVLCKYDDLSAEPQTHIKARHTQATSGVGDRDSGLTAPQLALQVQ